MVKKTVTNLETYSLGLLKEEQQMALAYAAADVYVLLSIEDNLPNTVLESLMCGTPVIGFKIGGVPDMIEDGQNGLLCKTVNVPALSASILQALDTNFDRAWIRRNALKRFCSALQVNKYNDIFETL